jgi:hypothetical protein
MIRFVQGMLSGSRPKNGPHQPGHSVLLKIIPTTEVDSYEQNNSISAQNMKEVAEGAYFL